MSNKWGIPTEVEKQVIQRDTNCVYCNQDFNIEHKSRKTKPSWEHIINDIRINTIDNIALCCSSCNASKGAKLLEEWLKSDYCNKKNINFNTVSQVIKDAIKNPPKLKL
jgi:5-methylcytosine-specific restriction endonuclease McrA